MRKGCFRRSGDFLQVGLVHGRVVLYARRTALEASTTVVPSVIRWGGQTISGGLCVYTCYMLESDAAATF